jgi:hypothetical protein
MNFDNTNDSDVLMLYRLIIPPWLYEACMTEYERAHGFHPTQGVVAIKSKLAGS